MATPLLHLLAGPNGAGKTTYCERVLQPATGLGFINADEIARERWPEATSEHAYEAAALAADRRTEAIRAGRSFITETVFSHPSKLDLLRVADASDYRRILHVLLIPEELAVARVEVRVEVGGHPVPEDKIRSRYRRLWPLLAEAISIVEDAEVLDNSRAATPFRRVARFVDGRQVGAIEWPPWTPEELRGL